MKSDDLNKVYLLCIFILLIHFATFPDMWSLYPFDSFNGYKFLNFSALIKIVLNCFSAFAPLILK